MLWIHTISYAFLPLIRMNLLKSVLLVYPYFIYFSSKLLSTRGPAKLFLQLFHHLEAFSKNRWILLLDLIINFSFSARRWWLNQFIIELAETLIKILISKMKLHLFSQNCSLWQFSYRHCSFTELWETSIRYLIL